jgi:hypothetical protein
MVFPATPLQVRVDLQISGVWADVTSDALARDQITITRGRADEASQVEPSKCNLSFKSPSGKYSPRNPTSPYFGVLGRNTPLRAGIGIPPVGAGSAGLAGTALAAPSVVAESAGWLFATWLAAPVGDFTVPVGFTAATESDGLYSTMRSGVKAVAPGATGTSTATFSTAATAAAAMAVVVPGPLTAALASIATDTGDVPVTVTATAGQYVLAVYGWSADPDDRMNVVADTDGGCEWMLIADTGPSAGPRLKAFIRRVTVTGDQRIHFYGDTRAVQVDTVGQVFVLAGASDYYPRFTGEVSSWPPKWDLSGRDVWVPVEASGIGRRLGQNNPPLRSPLYRELILANAITAYWPMEDSSGATGFASAIGGVPMMFIGSPQPSADAGFAASEALPTFNAAGAHGPVPAHTSTNQFAVGALIHIPATGMVDESLLLGITTSGTARTWTIKYDTGSQGFRVEVYNSAGVKVQEVPIGPWTPTVAGARFFLYLTAAASGANISWRLTYVAIEGDSFEESFYSNTVLAQTVGAVLSVGVGGNLDLAGDPSIGHVIAASSSTALMAAGSVYQSLVGWSGEQAHERVLRLCQEESIRIYVPVPATGFAASEAMGPQRPGQLRALLEECETADGGILYEPKGFLGLAFRPRVGRYNQTPEVTLSYSGGHISAPFEPVDDDQGIVNDVTVARVGGSSARAELTSGPLSVLPPPAGIGRYATSVDLNVQSDAQLPERASWQLHLGTWDEARWPSVHVDLAKNPALIGAVTAADVGDPLTLANLPAWVPPGPTDQVLEGYSETLGHPIDWDITGNCSPGEPYRVGVWDSTAARYSSDGSALAAGVAAAATALSVATPSGPVWIRTATHPAEFPFDIVVAGERMTVTAITGAASPQAFTVTRAVNGISKAQVAGAAVALYRPAYYAL